MRRRGQVLTRATAAIVPLYIGESAPKKIRGTLLALYQLQIIMGLFLSYVRYCTIALAADSNY